MLPAKLYSWLVQWLCVMLWVHGSVLWPVAVCFFVLTFQLNSPMNSVSSTEDIKPPLGLNGVMKVPAQPSGTALSLTKHICAICGDRSSGECNESVINTLINHVYYLCGMHCTQHNSEVRNFKFEYSCVRKQTECNSNEFCLLTTTFRVFPRSCYNSTPD